MLLIAFPTAHLEPFTRSIPIKNGIVTTGNESVTYGVRAIWLLNTRGEEDIKGGWSEITLPVTLPKQPAEEKTLQ